MDVIEVVEYIRDTIRTSSTLVKDIEISPPEIGKEFFIRRNFPCVNIWDMGYSSVSKTKNTAIASRLRRYTINILIAVRNPQTRLLREAYTELLGVCKEIDGLINDLSNSGDTSPAQQIILKAQGQSGQRVIKNEDVSDYLVTRIQAHEIEVLAF